GNENFRLKPAACVISARRGGTTATFDQMNKYFSIQEMPIITAKYWNMVHGTNPSEVMDDREGLMNMRILGRNMAFILKCKEIGRKQGLELPEIEPAVFTNFVR
ncbi:MAG: flavodoxin family protein, partial [Lachnospiraceae bacterium]|nr:flavodoxin family protein [Lachnospiraceae bacterium]